MNVNRIYIYNVCEQAGLDMDSVFIGMYLPPSQSDTETDNGVALLLSSVLLIFLKYLVSSPSVFVET